MFSENQLLLICNALTKSATKVLTAFMMAGTPLDIDGLVRWTRMERHSIDIALKQLKDYGLVAKQVMAHNRGVWMLATNVFPGMRKIGEPGQGGITFQNEGIPQTGTSDDVVVDLSLCSPTITTTTSSTRAQNEGFPQTGTSNTESSQALGPTVDRSPEEWAALKLVLDKYAIIGKKRKALIACEWVTADYFRSSVENAIGENLWDNPVGMAITRMLENIPVPAKREKRGKSYSGGYICGTCSQYPCVCGDDESEGD